MDYSRSESNSTKTYSTWVTFDEEPSENNYKNPFHEKFRENDFKNFQNKETKSIFHQWANFEEENFQNKLENSFTNSLESLPTSSTPMTSTPNFSRRNSESTSSFASSIDASLNLEKDNFWSTREGKKTSKFELVFPNDEEDFEDFISKRSENFATFDENEIEQTKRPGNSMGWSPEIQGSVHPLMGWSNSVLGRF